MRQVQLSLWNPDSAPPAKPENGSYRRIRVLITAKTAPLPTAHDSEVVCVAGLRLDDPAEESWIRLCPVDVRGLAAEDRFRKYEIVLLHAKPSRTDRRPESWVPNLAAMRRETWVLGWSRRRSLIDPHLTRTMCELLRDVRANPAARSLAVVPVAGVEDLEITRNPRWMPRQRAQVAAAAGRTAPDGRVAGPLRAPRFQVRYRYRCPSDRCTGHRQAIVDWDLAALQYRYRDHSDAELREAITRDFMVRRLRPNCDIAFFVSSRAARADSFSVLGVYNPPRSVRAAGWSRRNGRQRRSPARVRRA